MKKSILSVSVLLIALVLTLSSCGAIFSKVNLSKYKSNLSDSEYEIEIYEASDEEGEEEIQEIIWDFDEEYEDFGISLIMLVENDSSEDYACAYIILCESNKMAKEFADDIEDYSESVVVDGSFVLAGEKDIVNAALGK